MAAIRAVSLLAFTASLPNSVLASGACVRANSRSSLAIRGLPRGLPLRPGSKGRPLNRAFIHRCSLLLSAASLRRFSVRIRFDSDPDQGHGALCRHLTPDDRVLPLWAEFKHVLTAAAPNLKA